MVALVLRHGDDTLREQAVLPSEVAQDPAKGFLGSLILVPMILSGKEPIGSMGDTARLAIFSDERRSLYDFFVQQFAQVTNPPLDYLREAMVTDLVTHLGPRPNIFAPKELIPPAPALELARPVLSLQQMQILRLLRRRRPTPLRTLVAEIDCTFDVSRRDGLALALERIGREATRAVDEGHAIVLLSDRHALLEAPPVPSVLAVRAAVTALDVGGQRLRASIVIEAGDIRTTHQVACAIGFGATAVCPHLALDFDQQRIGGDDDAAPQLQSAAHSGAAGGDAAASRIRSQTSSILSRARAGTISSEV